MSRQTFPDNLIFANKASELDTPNASVYASAYESGKGKTPPKAGVHNALFKRTDEMLQHIERNGIPAWDARTIYYINGLALASNGAVYQSRLNGNSNKEPASNPGQWRFIISGQKIENIDATLKTHTQSIADNASQIRQNRSLSENNQSRIGQIENYINQLFNIHMERLFQVGSAVFRRVNPGLPVSQGGLGFGTWQDKAGRVPVGAGSYTDGNGHNVMFGENATSGEYYHRLTTEEMASHRHYYMMDDHTGKGEWYGNQKIREVDGDRGSDGGGSLWIYKTDAVGGDRHHNNIQPSFGVKIWYRVA